MVDCGPGPIVAGGLNNATGPGLVADCANRPPKLALTIRIYRLDA
jgi:hypothetical protein